MAEDVEVIPELKKLTIIHTQPSSAINKNTHTHHFNLKCN